MVVKCTYMKKSKKRVHLKSLVRIIIVIVSFTLTTRGFSQPCTPPTASISLVSSAVCKGSPASLQLSSATGTGPYNIIVNGNTYSGINVGQTIGPFSTADISIWSDTDIPANANMNDGQALEIGVKFRSSINGYITGIRFYKGVTNTGLHIGSLWSATGTLLAKANFFAETASGWQEIRFSSPVAITANTTYVASYYSQNGIYALTSSYFGTQGHTNGPLTALQSGIDGFNGVYKYGAGFPNASYFHGNYWVDVLFTETLAATTTDYTLTSITDANGCSNTGTLSTATLTINPLPSGTLTPPLSVCEGEQISLTYNSTSGTGPFSITTNSITNTGINNGQPYASGLNASAPSPSPVSIWPGGVTGVESIIPDNSPVELGVKFKSATTGSITGIRFYKRLENTGTHTGSLWSSNGTLLATATFTAESASGWQQVNFPFPIAITANQTFIASYFAPNGHYSFINNYFNGYNATNGPLTAIASSVADGPNGVYTYGGGFPTSSYQNANYWVDVVFVSNQGYNTIGMTQITDANGCTTTGSPIQSVGFASSQCIPLPVTLTDFRLSIQQKNIQLAWETSSENNNSGFEVQRSINNANWQTLGFVKGAGNSSVKQMYSYTDADLVAGKYYYRLKQIDFDNKFTLSKVLTAEIKGGVQNYLGQNYPNPVVQQSATINYGVASQSPVNISLYDVQGRMIRVLLNETKAAGQYSLNANLSLLTPGTYYYKMRTGNFTDTKKLVIGYR